MDFSGYLNDSLNHKKAASKKPSQRLSPQNDYAQLSFNNRLDISADEDQLFNLIGVQKL